MVHKGLNPYTPELSRVGLRYQPRDRHVGVEIGIAEIAGAVGEPTAQGFDQEVDDIG